MPITDIDSKIFHSLAQQYGTPLYIYHADKMRKQFAALDGALGGRKHSICYAVKANSNLSILKFFASLGSGFDIVSEGELRRLIACGIDPSRVVFSGVGKTESEIAYALEQKIKLINVESAGELRLIDKVAREMKAIAPIAFRINPDIAVDIHPYVATGLRTSKFGLPSEEALSLWGDLSRSEHLKLVGVDCHIGSGITEIEPLAMAYREVLAVARKFQKLGAPIKYLDLGGGLGVSYRTTDKPIDISQLKACIREVIPGEEFEIIFEPGRFLINEAGVLLTKVIYTKQNDTNRFAIVDAGMNDFIRPSLYEAYHAIELVKKPGSADNGQLVEIDIVGPVCETGCFLGKNRAMPMLAEGDLLAVLDAGAYGMSMASHYNTRRIAAEVLIEGDGSHRLIRSRESFEDIWKNELVE